MAAGRSAPDGHWERSRFTALVPRRPGWPDVLETPDPHGVRAKQPANAEPAVGAPRIPAPRLPAEPMPAGDGRGAPGPSTGPWRGLPGRSAPPPWPLLALLRLAELAAVFVVLFRLWATAFSAPAGAGEVTTAARVVARLRPDISAPDGPWPRQLFDSALAGWVSLTGALQRHDSALYAVREATLLAAALMVVAIWVLVVRLRLTAPARLAAILLLAVFPGPLTAVRPGALAAAAAVTGAALLAGERASGPLRIAAALVFLAAVALLPPLAAALLAALAVLLAQGDIAVRGRRLLATLAAVGAIAGVELAIGVNRYVGLDAPLPVRWLGLVAEAGGALPALTLVQRLVAAVAVVLVIAGAGRPWLRAPAAAVLALAATAIGASGHAADMVCVAIPAVAVTAAGAADELAPRLFEWNRLALGARLGVAAGVVLLLAVAAVVVDRPAAPAASGAAPAARWLVDELPDETLVLVDDGLWPDLQRAGFPPQWMRTPSGIGGSVRDPAVAWRVTTDQTVAGWTPCAAFGAVRILRPRAAVAGDERRRELNAALAGNPRLRLAPPAAAALGRGQVDVRLALVLAELAGQHDLDIADFPAVPGESADQPVRRTIISAVDGRPAATADLVRHWLNSQLDPYRPAAVDTAADALFVRYRFPRLEAP
jgi:hypothetical protein